LTIKARKGTGMSLKVLVNRLAKAKRTKGRTKVGGAEASFQGALLVVSIGLLNYL
jgi:hypothetical protein